MKPAADQHRPGSIHARYAALVAATMALLGFGSCSAPGPVPQDDLRARDLQHVAPAHIPPPTESRAALLNGAPVYWDDLHAALSETAGGIALQEAILDRLLEQRARGAGVRISADDIAAERAALVESILRDAGATPADAERLLEQVRRSRGLGEHRFGTLLARNAKMRKLVAPTVQVTEDEVRLAFEINHGPRYRARVILLATERDAAALRQTLLADPAGLAVRFAEVAAARSIDPSAPRGGVLDPISPADPAYPAAARHTLTQLKPGEVSPVVAVDRGAAIFLLEEAIPPDRVTLEAAADRVRAQVRMRRERLAMDTLARDLLRSADLSILHRGLEWSWRNSVSP